MEQQDLKDITLYIQKTFTYYMGSISKMTRLIYILIIALIVCALASLPLIHIGISVRARGIIRPAGEKTTIISLISGKIDTIRFREGNLIHKGEVLIKICNENIKEQLRHLATNNMVVGDQIHDLHLLLGGQKDEMASVKYKLEYINYINLIYQSKEKYEKARKERERYSPLITEQLISDKEYDDLVYNESLMQREYNYLVSSTRNQWQNELADLINLREQLKTEMIKLEEDLAHCEIRAPVTGTIDMLTGIYQGSNIRAGDNLAVISPDTTIIGEIYVPPSDIGLIHKGQKVMIIIDAFNYREWGTLTAIVVDISDDFLMLNNNPFFRIRCKLDSDFLLHPKGYQGRLRKGMTFQARCHVKNATFLELLTGRVDRSFNPAMADVETLSRSQQL